MFAWSDSTVVLCWIMSTNREWKQFVTNRIVKIRQKENLQQRTQQILRVEVVKQIILETCGGKDQTG